MSAAIIVATQNMANTNVAAGGPALALWILQSILCLFIFMGVTSGGSIKAIDRAGKILLVWLILSIPLFMWLF